MVKPRLWRQDLQAVGLILVASGMACPFVTTVAVAVWSSNQPWSQMTGWYAGFGETLFGNIAILSSFGIGALFVTAGGITFAFRQPLGVSVTWR